ncbi:MAG: hypothetical protein JWM89_1299 [Acidimicrobiales bacterium]|nr:hypothetical protein [Acidimicrobiales bacterium]
MVVTGERASAADRRRERNLEIATLYADGVKQREIRVQTGTSERTIRRLLQDDEFRRLVHKIRRERTDEINAKIPALVDRALEKLDWLLVNTESDTTLLGAIRTAIPLGSRLEAEEFADRLERLEQSIAVEQGWTVPYLDDEEPDDDDLDD